MQIVGLTNTLRDLAQQTPARPFAHTSRGLLTFADLSAQADTMAFRLAEAGAQPGDRILVMMQNGPAALALVHGILRAGMIWVPANPALVGDGLAHAISLVEASLIICDRDVVSAIEACGAPSRLGMIVVDDISAPPPTPHRYDGPTPSPRDIAALMFTSGTTGPSKAVMVTHQMLELAAQSVAYCASLEKGDDLYLWEPLYHIGGAQVIVLPILHDVTLTMRDRFSASTFWEDVSKSRCTHIHHLGGIVQILLKQPPSEYDKKHNVRIAWGGGCSPDAWRPFEERFGVELRECYGMTEASSLTTCNIEGVVGAVGRPLPWFTVEVKNEAGISLGRGEGRGEIVVNTDLPGAIFPGYYRNVEATAKALRNDGFYTGDLGSWDEHGMLRFHGRMGDSIRVRGENVSAYEVESVANRHPSVSESAMVGIPAEIGEYDIMLFVRPDVGAEIAPEELSAWLAERLAPYQRPRFISRIAGFPKTPSQRIQKHRLPRHPTDLWEQQKATTTSKVTT